MLRRGVFLFLAVAALAACAVEAAVNKPPPPPSGPIVAVGSFSLQPNGGPTPNITIGGKASLVVDRHGNATLTVNVTGSLQQITRSHIHWVDLLNSNNSLTITTMPYSASINTAVDLDPPISFKGAFSYVSVFPASKLDPWVAGMNSGLLFVNFKTVDIPQGAVWAPFKCKSGC